MNIDLSTILERAESRLNIKPEQVKDLKGVKKLMSKNSAVEPLEKGILYFFDISTASYWSGFVSIYFFRSSLR